MNEEIGNSRNRRTGAGRRRLVDRPILFNCLFAVFALLMVITMPIWLPIWLPILAVAMARDERRQRREISRIAGEARPSSIDSRDRLPSRYFGSGRTG